MNKSKPQAVVGGLTVEVCKDFYTGLWNVHYADTSHMKYAGPYKTKKEAVEVLAKDHD